jgi:hypothetical protein
MDANEFTRKALLDSLEFKRLLIANFKTCNCLNIHRVRRPKGWPDQYNQCAPIAVMFECCGCGCTIPIFWNEIERLLDGPIHPT